MENMMSNSKKVTLELTEHEAHALCYVCAKIGGESNGPRGSLDKIGLRLARLLGDYDGNEFGFYVPSQEFLLARGYTLEGSISVNDARTKRWVV